MSLAGFDSLRQKHPPEEHQVIARLETVLRDMLQASPDAVLDEQVLAQVAHLRREAVDDLLVELAASGIVAERWFWNCPKGLGVTDERAALRDFPWLIECERCGEIHTLNEDDLDVFFVSTPNLIASLPPRDLSNDL